MHTFKFSFVFLFFLNAVLGQTNAVYRNLNGKVTSTYSDLEGIYLINLKSKETTLTEHGGYFSIKASVGDSLVFSSVQFKALKVAVKETDFNKELFFVKMDPIVRFLDEVRFNEYKNINAVSLGIISPNTKHYTPAERKLNAASNAYPTLGVGNFIGGSAGLDPVLNWISGRTAMLKKEVEVEKKETLMDKVEGWFEKKYFIQTLKIPEDYVKGFEYYIVEDPKFAEAMKSKNKTMATFIMNDLAVKYNQLLKDK
ncbi:MAG: hypothetical protein RIQ59_339 [Bacteroidota bacterium]